MIGGPEYGGNDHLVLVHRLFDLEHDEDLALDLLEHLACDG